MMFAVLQDKQPDGTPWTREATQILAAQWRELLFTGGVDVTCYDIELHKLLVTLQRGWESFELKDFLIAQREVEYVEWDSVKYPGEYAVASSESAAGDSSDSTSTGRGSVPKPEKGKKKRKKGGKKRKKAKKAKTQPQQ